MRLTDDEAQTRLGTHDHGILCTVHPERGVDAVPVVYAVSGDLVGVPVDQVKPKSSTRLQRQRNLERDPRAALLVEHWDHDDWSRLWWVRAELRHEPHARHLEEPLASALATTFPQYADQPFAGLIVLRILTVTGWSGSAG